MKMVSARLKMLTLRVHITVSVMTMTLMDAQKVFKSTFRALINENYSVGIDAERYQGVLEHALSKVDFSVGTSIYMLPSNLNLSIGKTKGYNN